MTEQKDPRLGTVLDRRYRVLERIGEGGFGAVYTVQHVHTGKHFAVKVLHSEFAGDRHITERFWREAQAASLIEHENVVDIIDIGQAHDGALFFSMELLRGEALSALLDREGALPWPRVRIFAIQIARALCAAHAKGIIHRDLKPENCIRIRRGDNPDFVKVLDFGIAKIVHASTPESMNLTSRGEVLGTPHYMAPEQAAGSAVDVRVDVFSFGVLLFELLTNRYPFEGESRVEILTKMLTTTAPRVSSVVPAAQVPGSIDELIARTLHRDPAMRPASMDEVLAVLQSEGRAALSRGAVAPAPVAPVRARPPAERAATVPGRPDARLSVVALGIGGLVVAGLGMVVFFGLTRSGSAPASAPAAAPAASVAEPVNEPVGPEPVVVPVPEPVPAAAPVPSTEVPSVVAGSGVGATENALQEASPPATPVEAVPQELPEDEAAKASKKKRVVSPPPPASGLQTCAQASAKIVARAGDVLSNCKGTTGISTGDRIKVRIDANAGTGAVKTSVVSSSGSAAFDKCVVSTLELMPFPKNISGPQNCGQEYALKVP